MTIKSLIAAGAFGSLLMAQGCIATRDWVREQMDPVNARVTQSEGRLTQAEGQISSLGTRMSGVEGKLGQFEGRLGQVDEKAERALKAIGNLRLERKIVIDMKEGANFAFNSASLPAEARREIDGFLSDLKGEAGGEGTFFVVAGHTDNVGPEDYNYELGKRRADAVSRYLITQKKLDPMRVVSVSYGESSPLMDNKTPQGRAKNRRVEILVYREGITTGATAGQPGPQASQPAEQQVSQR
ncbi:MAG TPA: OmpA family protein [candidate division Zixibacteria bacterium]|nr:OmpA family protein [candidate division Zixibacteria bacterium]